MDHDNKRPTYSYATKLAMAQTMQHIAQKYQDDNLAEKARKLLTEAEEGLGKSRHLPSGELVFCNWDWRPAVLVSGKALAVLGPGEDWSEVDSDDVRHTAGVLSEDIWRSKFEGTFGPLDISKLNELLGKPRV